MIETLLSVVAPIGRDTPGSVEQWVEETVQVLQGLVTHYEIIVVDDAADPATVERVRELLRRHDFLRLLRLSRRFGEETAIAAGLDVSIGDYTVVMLPNADPPALIPAFLEAVRGGADLAYGVRTHRHHEPLGYRLGARVFYGFINGVLRAGLPEETTQFRCMTRQVVNAISSIRDPDRYLRLLTSYVGFRKQAIPYAPINRDGQTLTRPTGEAIALARALVIDHTTLPLRLVAWAAFAGGLVALVAAAIGDSPLAGHWQFLAISLVLAVMAEYTSGIIRRLRVRPAYYVSEEHTSSVLLREERVNVLTDSAPVP